MTKIADNKCLELLRNSSNEEIDRDLEDVLSPVVLLAYTLQNLRHANSKKWSERVSANCSDIVRTHLASRWSGV